MPERESSPESKSLAMDLVRKLGIEHQEVDLTASLEALGAYQKANGLKLDCWPTAAVLAHMQKSR